MPREDRPRPLRFQDIARLTDREIQMIVREVEVPGLAVSLRGANEAVMHRVFSNVSERVGAMIKEEMAFAGTVRRVEVEEARLRILQTMRSLQESGQITWPPSERQDGVAGDTGATDTARQRRRPATPAKPPPEHMSPLRLGGILGGILLVAVLLVWFGRTRSTSSPSDAKGKRSAVVSSTRSSGSAGKTQGRQKQAGSQSDASSPSAGGADGGQGASEGQDEPRGQESPPDTKAKSNVAQLEGQVSLTSGDSKRPAEAGALQPGDRIETGPDGRATLDLGEDVGRARVEENSSVQVEGPEEEKEEEEPPELDFRMGHVWVQPEAPTMKVKSPLARVKASKGSLYRLRVVLNTTTTVSVHEGTVWVQPLTRAGAGNLMLRPGDEVTIFPSGRVSMGKHSHKSRPIPDRK